MDINNYPLWTALITPMLANGDVDYTSLEILVRRQEEANNGILILGSTGEALNLALETRKEILEFICSLNPAVPLMAGVGGILLEDTLEWVKYLETQPIHTYLMVTPLYAKPGSMGQTEWFRTLMNASTKPVMLYNIPGRTGCALSHQTVRELANHPRLWAIKEASGSTEEFAQYVTDAPNAKVFSGDDPLLPQYIPFGCQGLISVASNVWPNECHRYVEYALCGTLESAELWQRAGDSMFIASNPIPAKRLLFNLELIDTPKLRAPLIQQDLDDATPLLHAHNEVTQWYATGAY